MSDSGTERLFRQIQAGDSSVAARLLEQYRRRLRRMVACRLDPRLSARVDASDVVQDALAEANQNLPEFLRQKPMSLHAWLRKITSQKLLRVHEMHLQAAKRSVKREGHCRLPLTDHSSILLINRVSGKQTTPSKALASKEQMNRVRAALDRLPERDHEILVMRYLERMSGKEIAETLEISESAVKMRQVRALERIKTLLKDESGSL